MRCLHEEYLQDRSPPLLRLTIHGAPHRRITAPGPLATAQESRAAAAIIDSYRVCLVLAGRRVGIFQPIQESIDLELTFIEPTSPDMDNLYVAFCQAADGGRFFGKKALLHDDSLISRVTLQKMFPSAWTEPNPTRLQLPRFVTSEAEAAA
jgi:hypothetical protein